MVDEIWFVEGINCILNSKHKNTLRHPQNTLDLTQNTMNDPRNTLSRPQKTIDDPQNTLSVPQFTLCHTQNTLDDPQNTIDDPQNTLSRPQNANSDQQNTLSRPQNYMRQPQKGNDNITKEMNDPLTHAYAHLLADVHFAGFAPAFTLSQCDSEYSRKPPMRIASVVRRKCKKQKNT
jgi:hypothetical protein